MGTTITPSLTTSGTVTPGTTVIQSVYTDTGFTAGDYVYRYGTGSVGSAPNTATAYLASITVPIANTAYSSGYGTVTFAKSNFKPFSTLSQKVLIVLFGLSTPKNV